MRELVRVFDVRSVQIRRAGTDRNISVAARTSAVAILRGSHCALARFQHAVLGDQALLLRLILSVEQRAASGCVHALMLSTMLVLVGEQQLECTCKLMSCAHSTQLILTVALLYLYPNAVSCCATRAMCKMPVQ